MKTYVLLFQCKDRAGIVSGISGIIFKAGANIVTADQYSTSLKAGTFFMRVEFTFKNKDSRISIVEKDLKEIARKFKARFSLFDKNRCLRMGIFASKPSHCLAEILYLWQAKELTVDIPFVVSNYYQHQALVQQYGLPFYFVKASKHDRKEKELLKLISKETDFLVLARYMLVLSDNFIRSYKKDIINIHHGLLPSFKGRGPYQQALDKGVKIIGATSHFVTHKLDDGPIIAQEVEGVSHKDDLKSLVRKGKDLEKMALIDAISAYTDYRIIRHGNKTIVF